MRVFLVLVFQNHDHTWFGNCIWISVLCNFVAFNGVKHFFFTTCIVKFGIVIKISILEVACNKNSFH